VPAGTPQDIEARLVEEELREALSLAGLERLPRTEIHVRVRAGAWTAEVRAIVGAGPALPSAPDRPGAAGQFNGDDAVNR
jgi:hypothetical protein